MLRPYTGQRLLRLQLLRLVAPLLLERHRESRGSRRQGHQHPLPFRQHTDLGLDGRPHLGQAELGVAAALPETALGLAPRLFQTVTHGSSLPSGSSAPKGLGSTSRVFGWASRPCCHQSRWLSTRRRTVSSGFSTLRMRPRPSLARIATAMTNSASTISDAPHQGSQTWSSETSTKSTSPTAQNSSMTAPPNSPSATPRCRLDLWRSSCNVPISARQTPSNASPSDRKRSIHACIPSLRFRPSSANGQGLPTRN